MSEQSLQVSRAVLGFPRRSRLRLGLAAGVLAAAAVSVAPQWWGQAAVSAARWAGRYWLAVVLVLVAVVLVAGGRRPKVAMAVGRRPRTPAMPLVVHVVLLLGLAAAVAVVVGVLLWQVLGQPILGGGSGESPGWAAQDRLGAVKVVLTVVGGVGAVVALTVAYRRQRLNEVEAYREDTKAIIDRYCKAAELLGAPDASVRTAGVYAFAALANDAPEARQGCIDVLCAYLRQPYDGQDRTSTQERQVRLTIIRLIRDNLHLGDDDLRTWRGHDFDFTGAVFDRADFTGATFTGAGTVTFADTTITGPVSFAGARFSGGTVSFTGARFIGGSVSFLGASFSGGVVDLSKVDGEHRPPSSALWPAETPPPEGLYLPD